MDLHGHRLPGRLGATLHPGQVLCQRAGHGGLRDAGGLGDTEGLRGFGGLRGYRRIEGHGEGQVLCQRAGHGGLRDAGGLGDMERARCCVNGPDTADRGDAGGLRDMERLRDTAGLRGYGRDWIGYRGTEGYGGTEETQEWLVKYG